MTTLRNLVGTMRDMTRDAQTAAASAGTAAAAAVAPVRADLTEVQHVVGQHDDALRTTITDAEAAAARVADLESAVDTLILDALMGGM